MGVLFISEDYVKRKTTVDENVDVKLINPTIEDCQNIYLHPCLGTQLFDGLKDRITNSTTTAADDTLISDYIAPMLVKWVQFELTTLLTFRYRNKNVSKQGSENSQVIDNTEYKYLLDNFRHKAEWYEQRLIDYLEAESDVFTEYYQTVNTNDLTPEDRAFTSPFWLGGSTRDCNERKYLYKSNE